MRRFAPALALAGLAAFVVALAQPRQAAVLGRLDYPRFVGVLALLAAAALALVVALAPAGRRRGVALRATSAGIGVALGVVAIEAVAWLWPPGPPPDNPFYLSTGTGVDGGVDLPFERPAHLDWTGSSRGDLAVLADTDDPWAREVTFHTDHQGFRNDTDEDRARIVFLGDSHTEAGNVPVEETFVHRVGEALGRSVRNLGRAGTSPSYQLAVLRRYGLDAEPDTVVWQVTDANDLAEEVGFRRWVAAGRPRTENWMQREGPARRRAWESRSPTRRLFRVLRTPAPWPRVARLPGRPPGRDAMRFLYVPRDSDDPTHRPGWRSFATALRDGRDTAADAGARTVVLFVPMKLRVYGAVLGPDDWVRGRPEPSRPGAIPFPRALRALCDALGLPLVDPTDALVAEARAGTLVYQPYDTHLSGEGHRVVAEALLPALRSGGGAGADPPPVD